ncbi:MAG: YihA family ribosome biogenesis GTP-binding protein [Bacteroidetes bacterium]|nr:MAG: YihA family ribosome biogenesis GTP-binding protein [Bacteroidota bacterium]
MQIKTAKFVISNTDYLKCPQTKLPEYAFIGRSNVGKSSLINMLVDRKNLAKTSGTPGKTQLINHFIINENWHIVDLPGFGYAKTSKKNRKSWEGMISSYLLHRENLVATFILIDSRLEPQKIDLEFISWLGEKELPFFLVFTKTDKLTKTRLATNIKAYREFLLTQWEELPVSILTSAKTKSGKDGILDIIESLNEEIGHRT